ncbi:penicillin-binding protein 2 [Patulibacter sp. NPDC049589]|uniref:peptidoglycan D,D-transpeptidase FtsI family protein n=1 Tax=Patulibacter sp. NPDC049589 TaxID=3154731 RepID=UPI00343D1C2A
MYADRRLRVLFTISMVLVSLAGLRSVWFALAKADTLSIQAAGQQLSGREVLALRGEITDRSGDPLAVSEPAADVAVSSKQVLQLRTLVPPQQPAVMAAVIAKSLDLPEDEVLAKLVSGKGFEYLGRSVPDTKIQAMKDRAKRQGVKLNGVTYTPRNRRVYPNNALAGQLLGSFGTDDKALSGLEYALDDRLRGTNGRTVDTNAASGSSLRRKIEKPMVPGKDVGLTLDTRIQQMTEDALQELGQTYRPKRATAIVMQPDGQVLSMANWPRIDPNKPNEAPDGYDSNLALNFNYEPGSTFKAVAVSGALQDRIVTPQTQFTVPGAYQVADRVINDSHPHGVEVMTPGQILAQSSNIGAIKIGQRLNAEKGTAAFDGWMRKFGFGKPTGIGMPEQQGLLLPVKDYSGSTMGNLPMGQGQLVTPMQIANLYATIANGGVLRKPTLVRTVGGQPISRPKGTRILRPDVAKEVRGMLTGVFEAGGTASGVKVPGYTLAGKTGTTEVFDEQLKEYSKVRNVASIAGFAPAQDPKVVIVVVADEPAGGGFGATVAGPAFAQIARYAMQYLKVPTNK